jgi:hypothetical protein
VCGLVRISLRSDPLGVRPRAKIRIPDPRPRCARENALDEAVLLNEHGVEDLALGILQQVELHSATKSGQSSQIAALRLLELKVTREVSLHGLATSPCTTATTHERLALEERHHVVVDKDIEKTVITFSEPGEKLLGVASFLRVAVVAIEECDTF